MKFKACSKVWLAFVISTTAIVSCVDNEGLNTDIARGEGGNSQGGNASGGNTGGGGAGGSVVGGGPGSGGAGAYTGSGGATTCGPICAIACEFGNVLDEAGCPTCSCKPPPKECGPNDCANQAAPAIAKLCPDGSSVGFSCRINVRGQCSLQQDECPTMCKPVTCKIACQFGFKKDASGCEICACAEAPACKATECGPPPPVAPCPGGVGPSMSCVRSSSTGKCNWNVGQCNDCSAARDMNTCEDNTACRWLEPGCSGNKLPVAGCFQRTAVNCESDEDCAPGKQCASRTVDHCANRPNFRCITCASPINVCL